jgi:hypothetical protein
MNASTVDEKMDYDDFISKMLNMASKQTFKTVNEFCNWRSIYFNEIFDVITYGKLETRIKVVLPSIQEMTSFSSSTKLYMSQSSSAMLKSFTEFGLFCEIPIEAIFDHNSKIRKVNENAFDIISNLQPVSWSKFPSCIELTNVITMSGKKYISLDIVKKTDCLFFKRIFTIYEDNEIVKFYDIGCE